MGLPRRIESEWLDELPADDRRAVRSRRDLKRVNVLMLQAPIMARCMLAACEGRMPRRILDLGSGDGTFMLAVAKRLSRRWPKVTVTALDQQDIVTERTRAGFRALGWEVENIAADVFTFMDAPRTFDLVSTNLFLHHFQPAQIANMFAGIAAMGAPFAACEPWRTRTALAGSHLLWVIGCNDVTRHDAVASVRAGFDGHDLSGLWPNSLSWHLHEGPAFLFTHCFTARPNEVRV